VKTDHAASESNQPNEPSFPLLERITGLVLVLVVVALAWMVAVAYEPTWLRFAALQVEVIVVVALLSAALALVSLVALLHTRSKS
jgi:hypothetical protein